MLLAAPPRSPLFGETQLQAALQQLKSAALLGRHPRDPPHSEALHYTGRAQNPAADVSLRTIDPERFVIWNAADASVLEEIEANMAFYEIYDGAIYMYQVGRVTQVLPNSRLWVSSCGDLQPTIKLLVFEVGRLAIGLGGGGQEDQSTTADVFCLAGYQQQWHVQELPGFTMWHVTSLTSCLSVCLAVPACLAAVLHCLLLPGPHLHLHLPEP